MSLEELENIIYTYGKDLYSFCCFITRNRHEAEDLYQDTFLKLYEMREDLLIEKNPKSYIMSVSVNLYRNYKRKRSIRQTIVGTETSIDEKINEIPSNEMMTEEQIIIQEECRLLRIEVGRLPDKYKIPILLFYMEDLSLTEISKILKLPNGTVKTRIHRAKKILKQKLKNS